MAGDVYQLKVSVVGIRPEVWRRLLVPDTTTLERLHEVLQIVMGWSDYHLYGFDIDGVEYGDPATDEYGMGIRSAKRAKLSTVIEDVGARLTYRYDFGDDWQHRIVLEKVLEPNADTKYPICVAGKRACPPEDCGGIYGYREFLEAIRDPMNEEHESMLEWAGKTSIPRRLTSPVSMMPWRRLGFLALPGARDNSSPESR